MDNAFPSQVASLPVGSGPFKWTTRQPNVSIQIRKNDQYFKKDKNGDPLP